MKAVGIKSLKARLSEYLRMVKAGETILVTERDTVVAELRPSERQGIAPSTLEEGLASLAERGQATLRSDADPSWPDDGAPPPLDGVSSRDILDAIREDRR
jgi:antitoxin (DNA-binding transcriptional repressor) of toxin-antitoxin stability system